MQSCHRVTDPGVSPEEPIGDRQADVEVDRAQNLHLCDDNLPPRVGVLADVQKVVQRRG